MTNHQSKNLKDPFHPKIIDLKKNARLVMYSASTNLMPVRLKTDYPILESALYIKSNEILICPFKNIGE
ncbi:MAG: hypothetical protein A2464_07345 [Deltaproteobacteria bacterium RIFOXYC2_FULL_48_10]|nr:MAG: hypothetical protein A2464_07345 [Deltaproteobacteria bacterium RIFOXYC2_FULL_48_10]